MADTSHPHRTLFGRKAAPEREALEGPEVLIPVDQLKVVRWTSPIPILDQEDLLEQGIHTSKFIPGSSSDAEALGSCTANATTSSLAERWVAAGKSLEDLTLTSEGQTFSLADGAATDEEFAIAFYYLTTTAYGGPGGNWPPNDDGSSGIYCCDELEAKGIIKGHRSASSVQGLLSLLQIGSAIVGGDWFNEMMTPDANGFVDYDGSPEAIQQVINSGVAGGHERKVSAIVDLVLTEQGGIDLEKTVLEDCNSWSPKWGPLGGSYRYHASLVQATLANTDFKQFCVRA